MIAIIYMELIDEPIVREFASIEEFCRITDQLGPTRLEKIILTDFHHRPENLTPLKD